MTYEVSQKFFFEAAHTLKREIENQSSARIHGHTYHAEITVRGTPDSETGMVMDLGHLRERIREVREQLDHHFLDEVAGLGAPTLENICAFIARQIRTSAPALSAVRVWREASGDSCVLRVNSE